ncbi:MAG: hypothetical protein RDV48_17715 [Candidatus Eremiobacteraeota bacterium]|nr:hypothetical protein [Candidatus Eremiobacteraeota bacterium]
MVSIKEFGRNSSFCGVLKKIMESVKEPISCEEITVHALEAWGRGFPANPYNDISLIYKLLNTYLDCEASYEDLKEKQVMVMRVEGGEVPLVPSLLPNELNSVVDQIKRIKFRLRESEDD